jgi:serine/threonine protein kinase
MYEFIGTPIYIAPEVILLKILIFYHLITKYYTIIYNLKLLSLLKVYDQNYDNSVDNWALGIMMYFMLFGNPPFLAPN